MHNDGRNQFGHADKGKDYGVDKYGASWYSQANITNDYDINDDNEELHVHVAIGKDNDDGDDKKWPCPLQNWNDFNNGNEDDHVCADYSNDYHEL